MLGFGRAAVLGGAQLEAGDELIIEVAAIRWAIGPRDSDGKDIASRAQRKRLSSAGRAAHHNFVRLAM